MKWGIFVISSLPYDNLRATCRRRTAGEAGEFGNDRYGIIGSSQQMGSIAQTVLVEKGVDALAIAELLTSSFVSLL